LYTAKSEEYFRKLRVEVILKMSQLIYKIGKLDEEEQQKLDFQDGLFRSVEERIRLGFIPMRLPVIDAAPYRIFDTMEEYRKWADENLPKWLGYYRC